MAMVTLVKTVLFGNREEVESYASALNEKRIGMMGENAALEPHEVPDGYHVESEGALSYESKQSLVTTEFQMAEEVSKLFPGVVANVMIINQDMSEAYGRVIQDGTIFPGGSTNLEDGEFHQVWGDDFSDTRILEELEHGAQDAIDFAIHTPRATSEPENVTP